MSINGYFVMIACERFGSKMSEEDLLKFRAQSCLSYLLYSQEEVADKIARSYNPLNKTSYWSKLPNDNNAFGSYHIRTFSFEEYLSYRTKIFCVKDGSIVLKDNTGQEQVELIYNRSRAIKEYLDTINYKFTYFNRDLDFEPQAYVVASKTFSPSSTRVFVDKEQAFSHIYARFEKNKSNSKTIEKYFFNNISLYFVHTTGYLVPVEDIYGEKDNSCAELKTFVQKKMGQEVKLDITVPDWFLVKNRRRDAKNHAMIAFKTREALIQYLHEQYNLALAKNKYSVDQNNFIYGFDIFILSEEGPIKKVDRDKTALKATIKDDFIMSFEQNISNNIKKVLL